MQGGAGLTYESLFIRRKYIYLVYVCTCVQLCVYLGVYSPEACVCLQVQLGQVCCQKAEVMAS